MFLTKYKWSANISSSKRTALIIKERGESIEIVTDSINIRVTEAVFPARKTRYI